VNKGKISKMLEYLFPNFTCLACGCELIEHKYNHVCDNCFDKFAFAKPAKSSAIALLDKKEKVWLKDIYCPFYYKAPVSKMVLALKYAAHGQAAQIFAPFMAKAIGVQKFDMIIPVPLAKGRQRDRGYNQAKVLADEVCKHLPTLQVCQDVLVKVRKTTPQTDMTPEARKENQANAYAIKDTKNQIKGKRILLIDDALTTGATANECARILRKAGVKEASLLCIARVGD